MQTSAAALLAHARAIGFLIRLMPMLPSRPIDRLGPAAVLEPVRYPTLRGETAADLYRPSTRGPHPAIVVCLGVVPVGVEHPQVPRLGKALARAGFAALLHWSPAMRDRRLVPDDAEEIAVAYHWLLARRDVDPARSGLFGTCVGGSFALLAAGRPLVRDRVGFVCAFAPFSSMPTLARDIASSTRSLDGSFEPWAVDPLTMDVFVRTVTDTLLPVEAERLRRLRANKDGQITPGDLSADGRAVLALLTARDRDAATAAIDGLPPTMQARLEAMSPIDHITEIRAPLILIGHDRDDLVIPVGESRRLAHALSGRSGVRYTEYGLFQHADPTKRKLSPPRLAAELAKMYRSLYPMFRQAVA